MRKSFRVAMAFFPRYFPKRPYKAFYCGSWLLDTQLEGWLPPVSNLVRFLKEFYLIPGGISETSILQTVFGGVPEDLSRAPRETTLQRAILDHLLDGKRIDPGAGKCFLFPEDLDWVVRFTEHQSFHGILFVVEVAGTGPTGR